MKALTNRLIPLLFVTLFTPGVLHAQAGMARNAVTELVEVFTRSGAPRTARELTEIGGERAVLEVVERAATQGGDDLVRQVVSLGRSNGPRAIKAMESDPALICKALRGLPENQLADAVTEAARNPALTTRLVRAHGDDVLTASARHPGIGTQVIDEFGEAGLKAAKQLDTDGVIALARTKGFQNLPEPAKRKFANLLDRNSKEVVNALILAGGATGIVLTAGIVDKFEDEIFGKDGEGGRLTSTMVFYSWLVGGILAASLAAYFAIKLRGVWKKSNETQAYK